MKRDSENIAPDDTLFANQAKHPDAARRKLLKISAAGLVAGIAGPILAAPSAAFAAENANRRILIAYYSRTGNTRELANQIHQRVGGELFEVRTVHTYPKEYRATTEQAKREQQANFRPQLTAEVPNMEAYDTIFIGYPNWWGTLPMAFFTFLEKYDLAGKTLIPFSTHEGSHFGRSVKDMQALCPNSRLLEGIALRGGDSGAIRSESARREVAEWLQQLSLAA